VQQSFCDAAGAAAVVVDVGAQHRRNLYQSRNCLVAKIPIKATIPNLTSAALQNRNFRNGCKSPFGRLRSNALQHTLVAYAECPMADMGIYRPLKPTMRHNPTYGIMKPLMRCLS